MSVSAQIQAKLTVAETLATNVPAASVTNRVVTHDQYNQSLNLDANTTPAASGVAAFNKAMSSGAATVDLTAVTGTNGATVNGNGLKVRAILVKAPTGNANPVVLSTGASNGHNLFGSAGSIELRPGDWFLHYFGTGAPTIGSSSKTLDLAGTGTQSLDFEILFG